MSASNATNKPFLVFFNWSKLDEIFENTTRHRCSRHIRRFAGSTGPCRQNDAIKARGQVVCGVNTGLAGFAAADSAGKWSGLDIDVCKALAAATLGDAEKVKYVPLNAQQRFTALQSGDVDVLARNTTFTLTRDASLGLSATVVNYYDGQGFMVPVKTKMKGAKQLKGQTVCVQSGTTTEKNLTDYSKANGLGIKPVVFEKLEAANAYFTPRCIVTQRMPQACLRLAARLPRILKST